MSIVNHDTIGQVSNTIYWLLAVEYQRDRILLAFRANGRNNYPFRSIGRMEEHYFLVACNKARRWLAQLDESLMTPAYLDAFKQHADQAKCVRDNREHDEERYGKSPTRQDAEHMVNDPASLIKITVSTSVTVRTGGRLLLGGICDIDECATSAAVVRAELQAHERVYWATRLRRSSVAVVDSYCSPERLIDCHEG